jgi:hypothetical protein
MRQVKLRKSLTLHDEQDIRRILTQFDQLHERHPSTSPESHHIYTGLLYRLLRLCLPDMYDPDYNARDHAEPDRTLASVGFVMEGHSMKDRELILDIFRAIPGPAIYTPTPETYTEINFDNIVDEQWYIQQQTIPDLIGIIRNLRFSVSSAEEYSELLSVLLHIVCAEPLDTTVNLDDDASADLSTQDKHTLLESLRMEQWHHHEDIRYFLTNKTGLFFSGRAHPDLESALGKFKQTEVDPIDAYQCM